MSCNNLSRWPSPIESGITTRTPSHLQRMRERYPRFTTITTRVERDSISGKIVAQPDLFSNHNTRISPLPRPVEEEESCQSKTIVLCVSRSSIFYEMTTFLVSAHSPNRRLMLSPLWVLRILSAMVGLMSMTTILEHFSLRSVCGMVLVTCEQTSG